MPYVECESSCEVFPPSAYGNAAIIVYDSILLRSVTMVNPLPAEWWH